MTRATVCPPETVQVLYKRAGQTHVFTSPDLNGLHIGNSDLEAAFKLIVDAISALVEADTGATTAYKFDMSFEEFETSIRPSQDGGVVDFNLLAPSLTATAHAA